MLIQIPCRFCVLWAVYGPTGSGGQLWGISREWHYTQARENRHILDILTWCSLCITRKLFKMQGCWLPPDGQDDAKIVSRPWDERWQRPPTALNDAGQRISQTRNHVQAAGNTVTCFWSFLKPWIVIMWLPFKSANQSHYASYFLLLLIGWHIDEQYYLLFNNNAWLSNKSIVFFCRTNTDDTDFPDLPRCQPLPA